MPKCAGNKQQERSVAGSLVLVIIFVSQIYQTLVKVSSVLKDLKIPIKNAWKLGKNAWINALPKIF